MAEHSAKNTSNLADVLDELCNYKRHSEELARVTEPVEPSDFYEMDYLGELARRAESLFVDIQNTLILAGTAVEPVRQLVGPLQPVRSYRSAKTLGIWKERPDVYVWGNIARLLETAIRLLGSKPNNEAPDADERPTRRARGPKARMERHRAIAEIVYRFGPAWTDDVTLGEVCSALDEAQIPPPRSEKFRRAVASWDRANDWNEGVVKKAIEYSLKMAGRKL